jgi:hypothetical protein
VQEPQNKLQGQRFGQNESEAVARLVAQIHFATHPSERGFFRRQARRKQSFGPGAFTLSKQ